MLDLNFYGEFMDKSKRAHFKVLLKKHRVETYV